MNMKKALIELEHTIINLTSEDLVTIVDRKTEDPDCKSIQTILTHIISSGYVYVIEIRKSFGEKIDFIERKTYSTPGHYISELKKMFSNTNEQLFTDYPNSILEVYDPEKKILVSWGQRL